MRRALVGLLLLLSAAAYHSCKSQLPALDDDDEALVATPKATSGRCGVERWSVKTGTDADASKVNMTPQATTVAALGAIPAPTTMPANSRVAPAELQAVTITNVTLTMYKLEGDSDYHVDVTDGTNHMITEIPDPACVGAGSIFAAGIQRSRAAFDSHYTVTTSFQNANDTVTITGVPFFDIAHGQSGAAPNFIEIHAITDICWGKDCAGGSTNPPDFTLTAASSSVTGAGGTTLQAAPVNGFSGTIALAVSGAPSGATASVSPASIAANGTATLSLDPGHAAAGSYTVTVTGTSGSLSHAVNVAWTIQTAPTFQLTATPSSLTSSNGAEADSIISSSPPQRGAVSRSVSGVPSGASATWRPVGNGSDVLMLQPGTAAAGTYPITVTGVNSAGVTATATITWTISGGSSGFSLSVSPASQSISAGSSGSYAISTSGTGQIALAVSGLPAGVTGSPSPSSVAAGASSTLALAVSSSTAAGATSFTVTGTSGGVSHTASASLTITSTTPDTTPPVVQITAPAAGATVSGTVTVSATATDDVSVSRMELDADGVSIGTGTGGAISASWDTSSVAAGSHSLVAKAWDPAGNLGTSPAVQVTVSRSSGIRTVFIILMENHNWSSIKGSSSAPYINNTLLTTGAHTEQYFNPPGNHPSLPNYLWLEAGTNFGIANDSPPSTNHQSTTAHLVTQLEAKGLTWKSYQENISGTTCPLAVSGLYAPKHNPMVYFDDVTSNNSASSTRCIQHVRPFTELASDLSAGRAANYNFITPNLCNDMHGASGCPADSIATGDTWLANNVPAILASHAYQQGGALFITWDESVGGDVPVGMIVLSPQGKGSGYSNTIAYSHSSTLRTVQEIFGLTPLLGDAANATNLSDLFRTFP
jgi:hypothetical protein